MNRSPSQLNATADSVERWQDYAREITRGLSDDAGSADGKRGTLLILGSGLCHTDMMLNDEQHIRSADYVFHCLYDRVTQVWLSDMRPDALDLRILYNSAVPRNTTYICMAEALLHRVRQGRRVVAIFYGHPGFFATPAHRAVHIARAEGHTAVMRPGISALDYMVADIGFDPMVPGLLSYEATDLLVRNRRLDPSLHTVLWQVGVTGELGYSPTGFENRAFEHLSTLLLDTYGPDAHLYHYIAPQYVGVDPLIDKHLISDLKHYDTRSRITSNSTFYIPPQKISRLAGSVSLRSPGGPEAVTRHFDKDQILFGYGSEERDALRCFQNLQPESSYLITGKTPAFELLIAISRDVSLRNTFLKDPEAVFRDDRFQNMSERVRKLLKIGHPLAINAALAEP